jgi:hypothetical protein
VLGLSGHGCDGYRFVNPLAHEQWCDEIVHSETDLGDQATEGGGTAEAAEAASRRGRGRSRGNSGR